MDIFEGSPREKFFEILYAASPTLVQNEIEEALIRLIACERLCETRGISEREIESFIAQQDLQDELNDKFLQMSGNILSNNE
nr:DUF2018 family protein [uncultured Campylobacter sp.]